ncbi:hypothetical protein, partial [Serratia rubidaea]|uniref:hypothetical protein n=1 Tax=Serratia rubidaea TaxID=61652 RepID=UPI003FA3A23F
RPSGYEPDELPGCSTPRPMDAHYTLHALCCNPFLQIIGLKPFFGLFSPHIAFFFITLRAEGFFIGSDSFLPRGLLSFAGIPFIFQAADARWGGPPSAPRNVLGESHTCFF